MSNLFALNFRFAPQPQAGSKSRVICFCSAIRFRFRSASETVLLRLTIEIVGFIALSSPLQDRVLKLRAVRRRDDMPIGRSESTSPNKGSEYQLQLGTLSIKNPPEVGTL